MIHDHVHLILDKKNCKWPQNSLVIYLYLWIPVRTTIPSSILISLVSFIVKSLHYNIVATSSAIKPKAQEALCAFYLIKSSQSLCQVNIFISFILLPRLRAVKTLPKDTWGVRSRARLHPSADKTYDFWAPLSLSDTCS